MANGSTQFVVGWMLQSDPRHVSCKDDPRLIASRYNPDQVHHHEDGDGTGPDGKAWSTLSEAPCAGKSWLKRPGHVLLDTLTYRRSRDDGYGRRMVSFPRLIGAFAGAYASSPWEPAGENTFRAVGTRAGTTLVTPLLGSFLHEYPGFIAGTVHYLGYPFRWIPAVQQGSKIPPYAPRTTAKTPQG